MSTVKALLSADPEIRPSSQELAEKLPKFQEIRDYYDTPDKSLFYYNNDQILDQTLTNKSGPISGENQSSQPQNDFFNFSFKDQ